MWNWFQGLEFGNVLGLAMIFVDVDVDVDWDKQVTKGLT